MVLKGSQMTKNEQLYTDYFKHYSFSISPVNLQKCQGMQLGETASFLKLKPQMDN